MNTWTQVTEELDGYGGYAQVHDVSGQNCGDVVSYTVQVRHQTLADIPAGVYDELVARTMRLDKWLTGLQESWSEADIMGHWVLSVHGHSMLGKSPLPAIWVLINKGWWVIALYTLRYHQDYGMSFQQAFMLAYRAVWGENTEERAENTPGVAVVEGTYSYQLHHGMIPAGAAYRGR